MSERDILRTVRLAPYRKGQGPTFTLIMYATNGRDWRGQTTIGYEFRQHLAGQTSVVFAGDDFHGSPRHADDADRTVASLLGFLTLRPGDTDREYFERDTPAQAEYRDQHAETLAGYVMDRFGED